MYLDMFSFIILAVLALPVSTGFFYTVNYCLHRHAELMLEEEGIENPHINLGKPILWCTVFVVMLVAYLKATSIANFTVNTLFLLGLLLVTYIDIKYQYIFDEVLLAMAALAIIATPYIQDSWTDRLLGVFAGGLVMLLVALLSRGMLGGGDIKMVAMFGLWHGLAGLQACVFIGFVSAAVFAILAILTKQKKMSDSMAFGPYLALGAFVHWLSLY